ncbi:hypothetical protein [Corynebacterium phoceense]|uniref:hypothetical protein n=1 Tax=Corynebacterium phoceense TaxID=1686286 RepID=UPI001DF2C365|nr:hypothetical protein [Corynebacterium phoceense]HJG42678.1 hypothetical protein [Corynebacterium phoceense]
MTRMIFLRKLKCRLIASLENGAHDKASHNAAEPMSAFKVRLPASVLNKVRDIAAQRGETTGLVLREIVETAVADAVDDDATISVAEPRKLITTATDSERLRERPAV